MLRKDGSTPSVVKYKVYAKREVVFILQKVHLSKPSDLMAIALQYSKSFVLHTYVLL